MSIRTAEKTARINRGLALILMLALVGCESIGVSSIDANSNKTSNSSNTNMEEQKRPSTDKVDPRLVEANTKFGLKLYGEVIKGGEGKNLFVSPASVGLCLAMVYNGAEGETRQAMARALEALGLNLEEFNRAYADLKASLENPDPKVQLEIANSLWARKGLTFKPDFIERDKKFYGAEVTALDFNDPGAPATINSWVKDKTKGKIDKIVDQISNDSILFLINAIYFKGKWAKPFDKNNTKEEPFTLTPGSQKRVQMMSQSGEYQYLETPEFQAVKIPYGGGRVSMYVFLPAKTNSLDKFHKSMTSANWDDWTTSFHQTEGSVKLPRFKVEYEVSLNDALKALGMGVAFDEGRADFSGMIQSAERVYISRVKHKTFAEVNEEGTEAAAVTSTEMRATSAMRPRQPFQMVVDRPFFCAIRDDATGTVLFMGSIFDPL